MGQNVRSAQIESAYRSQFLREEDPSGANSTGILLIPIQKNFEESTKKLGAALFANDGGKSLAAIKKKVVEQAKFLHWTHEREHAENGEGHAVIQVHRG